MTYNDPEPKRPLLQELRRYVQRPWRWQILIRYPSGDRVRAFALYINWNLGCFRGLGSYSLHEVVA
jgi:hypothetical protein